MSTSPEQPSFSQRQSESVVEPLRCPEDVDWILDVDNLVSAGGEPFRIIHGLLPAPSDCPHFPFDLTTESASVWNQTVRKLSMASGESHIIVTANGKAPHSELTFYARVAGYREQGVPHIAAVFQKLEKSSMQNAHDGVWQNWLYLLHEIKNTVSLLRRAEDSEPVDHSSPDDSRGNAASLRSFSISCLENHLRNGVLLATEEGAGIPNNPVPLDLKFFFEDLTAAYSAFLKHNNVRVRLDFLCDDLRTVRLDRTLLEQLLNNLLINKEKCLLDQELRIVVEQGSLREDGSGHQLIIIIEDEGPPFADYVVTETIPEADIGGLLDLNKNSGLGLLISRRIVTTLGGDLRFFNDGSKRRILLQIPVS